MQDLDVWRKAGKISADLQMHGQAITCYKEVQAPVKSNISCIANARKSALCVSGNTRLGMQSCDV